MALTRARVVAGPPVLREKVRAAIATAIAGARSGADQDRCRGDAGADGAGPAARWTVGREARPGGQIDVEFIAQVLQLVHARQIPGC